MAVAQALARVFDPARVLEGQGFRPDPWQTEVLRSRHPRVLLNCSRQAGKSTTVAAAVVHELLSRPAALVLLVAPSERQSRELFRKAIAALHALGDALPLERETQTELEFVGGARLVALPGREDTVRSYSGVNLLVIDEASRVPDALYRSVRPMLAVSRGRLIALSTPFGPRGWFYEEWVGPGPWLRVQVPWTLCPRISADFIAEETQALGQEWTDQEYGACFVSREGRVYPDFEACVTEAAEPIGGRRVGGIDFGWRNPFAAVWGAEDSSGVLRIVRERYATQATLEEHGAALPRDVDWVADPAGASDIGQLRRWGFRVRTGRNDLRSGIARVTARLRTGKLLVHPRCVNLIREASLYRYPSADEGGGELPRDEHNHALAALRYLVSRLPEPRRAAPILAPPSPTTTWTAEDAAHWCAF